MVVLNKIYTRTGDDGTTALGTGERRPKYDLRIETYGTVDETNAVVGVARAALGANFPEVDAMLGRIQNDLFDLGAELATPDDGAPKSYEPLRVIDSQVARLESEIDTLNADLQPLRSFVLPGGSAAAAALHLGRTVSRRAERLMVELAAQEPGTVGDPALRYVNRLSDFLFVASRWVNAKGEADVLWVPGKNR
ncbi:cob(I)yrinic acid a,c-diamide adenosyltransferase [Faunimonas sp. B44]|uniref:cob(I)yrinic acid a,c-diamide adenosyltransferase n=1 Tax=Faunimonas sp. B44 TaxID=3461493 RepID=UPI004044F259